MVVIEPFTKGSTVEVSSEEDGFYGAWYVATLVDIIEDVSPTKKTRSSTKKKKKNTRDKKKVGYLVKYDTLFQENDHTEPLTEVVDPLHVRPLPPRNGDGGGEFEVCDVVDAYLRDGWWIGVVKKVNVVEGELMMMRKYVVEFESPPEEVEFVGSEMRLHLDWVDSTWKVRSQKIPNQESITKIATHTSDSNNESNNGANSDFITPTKKALKTDSAYLTISGQLSAKRRSHLRKKVLTKADTIRELNGSAKFRRSRTVVNVDDDEEELHENFKSSAGVENSGSKGNTEEMVSMMETSAEKPKAKDQDSLLLEQETIIKKTSETRDGNSQLKRKRGRPSNSSSLTPNASSGESKGNTEVMVSMMVTSAAKAKAKDQDSLLLEQETIIKETSETLDGNNQLKRKRGRPSKSSSLTQNASLEDDQEAGKMGSSGIYEITNELDEQPLAVWYKGLHPLPVSKKNSCNTTLDHDEPIAASNPTMVNDGQTTENNQILPFVKQSPIWAAIESLEVYQNLSQNPHFSPLWKNKEDCREGLAIAHMITFANLVQRTTNLQWTDPNHIITNSLESLVDLEDNGFDVGPVRVRLDELLAKKDEASRLEGEMKETEKEVKKCNCEKMVIVEEINGLERKMEELEEMMVKAVAMKNGKDEEVKVIRSKLQVFSKRIADWKLAFEELVGHPL